MADFTTTTWVDGSDPAITAAQLNRMEAGILDAVRGWHVGTLLARPTANAASQYWGYFATDDNGGTPYVNFDGANWTKIAPAIGSIPARAGHILVDSNGNPLTQRSKLKVIGGTVTDDSANDQTVISVGTNTIASVDVVNVATYTFSTLSGDTDDMYELIVEGDLILPDNTKDRFVIVNPNAVAGTNFLGVQTYVYNGSAGTSAPAMAQTNGLGWVVAQSVGSHNSSVLCRATMGVKSGRTAGGSRRMCISDAAIYGSSGYNLNTVWQSSWPDTTTVVNSLVVGFQDAHFTGRLLLRKVG